MYYLYTGQWKSTSRRCIVIGWMYISGVYLFCVKGVASWIAILHYDGKERKEAHHANRWEVQQIPEVQTIFRCLVCRLQKCRSAGCSSHLNTPPPHQLVHLSCLSSDSDHLGALNETETLPCLEQPRLHNTGDREIRIMWPDQPLFSNNVL